MSTITTINASDLITDSRTVINTNFSNLNTDKIETSVLDTDTALTANSDAKVATQKATKAYVDANVGVESEFTAAATHSLTTTATQKVVVWAKGSLAKTAAGATSITISLKYNNVTKDTVVPYNENTTTNRAWALMYTETPGAATADITVTTDGGSLSEVVIMVLKIPA